MCPYVWWGSNFIIHSAVYLACRQACSPKPQTCNWPLALGLPQLSDAASDFILQGGLSTTCKARQVQGPPEPRPLHAAGPQSRRAGCPPQRQSAQRRQHSAAAAPGIRQTGPAAQGSAARRLLVLLAEPRPAPGPVPPESACWCTPPAPSHCQTQQQIHVFYRLWGNQNASLRVQLDGNGKAVHKCSLLHVPKRSRLSI